MGECIRVGDASKKKMGRVQNARLGKAGETLWPKRRMPWMATSSQKEEV